MVSTQGRPRRAAPTIAFLELEGLARRQGRGVPGAQLLVPLRQRVTQEFVHLVHTRAIDRLDLAKVLTLSSRWSKIRIEIEKETAHFVRHLRLATKS